MIFLGLKGFRVIAHDRRGHGRSFQPWERHTMDQYADDLVEFIDHLGLKKGNSRWSYWRWRGRYIGRHGGKVIKCAFNGVIPPLMMKSEENLVGTPIEVIDDII